MTIARSMTTLQLAQDAVRAMDEAERKYADGDLSQGAKDNIIIEAADDLRAHVRSLPEPGEPVAWPFVESPGEFTERLHEAMQHFPLIGAVRYVLIENPPTLTTPQPAVSVTDEHLRQVDDARRYTKLMYGFMLDCNAIGAEAAGVNLRHSIKDHLAALGEGT